LRNAAEAVSERPTKFDTAEALSEHSMKFKWEAEETYFLGYWIHLMGRERTLLAIVVNVDENLS
jgi:hypothetical protein